MTTPPPTTLGREEIARLEKVAREAPLGPWATDYRFGEASMVIRDDAGRLPLATTALYPLAQNRPQVVEAVARHIATFDPPTVLDLLSSLSALSAQHEADRARIGELEAGAGASISAPVSVWLQAREDGGLRVWSDDLGGLILSGSDPRSVGADIWPVIEALRSHRDLLNPEQSR